MKKVRIGLPDGDVLERWNFGNNIFLILELNMLE